ncbi:hypothetical protein [Sinomonas sp. ASV322]|uniref:hypothetical protein n=1 Tax=Sinomonas sp. ASV322 TaxID=3041920 RepID=UPI0027DCA96C|nr:hypothetical protein [Sinomonas sp. ASV322]MDQ4502612.1 hypothetical protein [Sinomonas sp. ASV322]
MRVVLVLVLAACAPGPDASTSRKLTSEDIKASARREASEGHAESAEMLADGAVDKADYDKAFSNLFRCMSEGGYGVTNPQINPADGLSYSYEYDTQGRDSRAMSEHSLACEQKYWFAVSAAYMATNEQRMEESLRASMQTCMKAAGYDIPDDAKTFRTIAGDPFEEGTRNRRAMDCFSNAMTRLHPDIKSFGLYG